MIALSRLAIIAMDYLDLYNFQSSTGIVVPNDAAVLEGVREKFAEIFGTDIDLSAETPVGRLIEAFAVLIKSALGVTAQSANQFNIDYCTGIYLDSIGRIYNMERLPGTKTRIKVECRFTSNIVDTVPAGSRIMNKDTGAIFTIDSNITRDNIAYADGKGYYAETTATAEEFGPEIADIGTVNVIQNQSLGWIGVSNTGTLQIGTFVETDEEFRARIKKARSIGVGFKQSLEARLRRIDGVYSVCILENNNKEEAIKNGVLIPGHSIFVCAYTGSPNPGEVQKNAIAEAIVATKPAGTGIATDDAEIVEYGGATKHEVDVSDGLTSTTRVTFYTPAMVRVKVTVTINTNLYTGSSLVADIDNAVVNYVNGVAIGESVYSTMMAKSILANVNGVNIASIELFREVSEGETEEAANILTSYGYQKFYTEPEDITIEEV